MHGKNARICNNGQIALRPHAFGEFNDAIVFSNRPLRDGELFEVTLDHMVDRWSGSIELGTVLINNHLKKLILNYQPYTTCSK